MTIGKARITICPFDRENNRLREELAQMFETIFPQAYQGVGKEEADSCLADDRIAIIAVAKNHLVGFIGAILQYGTTGYELHPIMVDNNYRSLGIGTLLIKALETEVVSRGGITIYLGTDDEFGKTSLSGCDLYDHTFERIKEIKNLHRHPYEFYQKLGYQIVGVIPDANGFGKPDIWMAKRVRTDDGFPFPE